MTNLKCKWLPGVAIIFLLSKTHFTYGDSDDETTNPCVAQSVPGELLDILILASQKILKEQPIDVSVPISKVSNKISLMSEDLSKFAEENKQKLEILQDIIKSQKGFNKLLDSSFNTILNNNNILTNLQENNLQSFNDIMESLTNINVTGKGSQDPSFQLLEDIFKNMNNTIPCKTPHSSTTSSDPVISEMINKQNETNSLLELLINETQELQSIKEQLETTIEENKKLKLDLKKSRKMSNRPSDCNDLLVSGITKSGVYQLYPDSCRCGKPILVWCDMESDGGGWTVIISRGRGSQPVNFTRSWTEYKSGFGHPETEYWIGNTNLHHLTSNRRYSLRVEVTNKSGRSKWGYWGNFEVASEKEKYRLSVGNYLVLSPLGNVLKSHNNQYFTTYDQDNDSSYAKNCAEMLSGGWWYAKCYDIHPTGILNAIESDRGLATSHFGFRRKAIVPLQTLTMKIKPKSCTYESSVTSTESRFCDPENP